MCQHVCHVTQESAVNHMELMRDRTHQVTVMRLAKGPQTADCHLLLFEMSTQMVCNTLGNYGAVKASAQHIHRWVLN